MGRQLFGESIGRPLAGDLSMVMLHGRLQAAAKDGVPLYKIMADADGKDIAACLEESQRAQFRV